MKERSPVRDHGRMHECAGVGSALFICQLVDTFILIFPGILHVVAADLLRGESDDRGRHATGDTRGSDNEAKGPIVSTFVGGPRGWRG